MHDEKLDQMGYWTMYSFYYEDFTSPELNEWEDSDEPKLYVWYTFDMYTGREDSSNLSIQPRTHISFRWYQARAGFR